MLTERQQEILNYITQFRLEHGCSPSIPEMQRHFGIRSPNGIVGHLQALEAKGVIRRGDRGSRRIDLVGPMHDLRVPVAELPLFGSIPAGTPQEISQQRPDACVSVDEQTLGFKPSAGCFVLRVRGESMRDAGILDGDLVVAEPTSNPRGNQIVVALIDGESTLKRLVRMGDSWFLRAENPDFPELIPRADLRIQGVVRTVIRQVH
ncbi:MAG: transcriptional repressor LexA [Bryobacterales bacterium]|nr:transcriptional repressor LexA [Bryobacterales bacterium]